MQTVQNAAIDRFRFLAAPCTMVQKERSTLTRPGAAPEAPGPPVRHQRMPIKVRLC
jgi:hypothetical protein